LARNPDPAKALQQYEAKRLKAANELVLRNRTDPPDAILREVWKRSGDKPFARIEDVISREELIAISESYKRVAGFEREALAGRGRLA
jgi:hypothetical protein